MRWHWGLSLTLFMCIGSGLAQAQDVDRSLEVFAHDGGGRFWFKVPHLSGENPPIRFDPGDHVQVDLRNDGSLPHNIHFAAPVAEVSEFVPPNRATNLSFQVPPDLEPQRLEYWCDAHREQGMVGQLLIGEVAAEATKPAERDVPGVHVSWLLAALVGIVLMTQRRSWMFR